MHVTVDAQHLADTTAWVDRFAPNRPTVPVLAAQLLTATTDGTLTLAATDYDTTAHANIDAGVHQPGQVAVSSRVLAAATARLGTGPATLHLDGWRLNLTCGTTSYTLATLAAEDYPTAPQPPAALGQVDATELAAATTCVSATLGGEKTLPEFRGIQLHLGGDLTLASSDRYRMTARTLGWHTTPNIQPVSVLAPGAALAAAVRGMTGAITLGAHDHLLALSDDARTVTTTLLDNTAIPHLPDFLARRFDAGAATTATVDTVDLIAAIDSASAVVDTGAAGFVTLTVADDTITATGGNDDTGTGAAPAHTSGPAVAAMYHPHWLLGLLKATRADTVRLHLPSATAPTLLTTVDADDGTDTPGYRALVNPRRHITAQAAA